MYFFITPFLTLAFIGWILYHAIIKKDLKEHRTELYGGLVFIVIWLVLYYSFISAAG